MELDVAPLLRDCSQQCDRDATSPSTSAATTTGARYLPRLTGSKPHSRGGPRQRACLPRSLQLRQLLLAQANLGRCSVQLHQRLLLLHARSIHLNRVQPIVACDRCALLLQDAELLDQVDLSVEELGDDLWEWHALMLQVLMHRHLLMTLLVPALYVVPTLHVPSMHVGLLLHHPLHHTVGVWHPPHRRWHPRSRRVVASSHPCIHHVPHRTRAPAHSLRGRSKSNAAWPGH